jgi:hypothetical protein
MPRISSYPKDETITGSDKWIGSDGNNGFVTKNFSPDALADYYIDSGKQFGSNTVEFEQTVSSNLWTINHNLGRYPSITVVDSSGNVVVGFETYNSENQITLTFSAPFSGTVYLN